MPRFSLLFTVIFAALSVFATESAQAGGLERLYILNCDEGMTGDISRWSPGVNVGQSMPFVDNCYLLKHAQGWLLWDTGVPDAIAAMERIAGILAKEQATLWINHDKAQRDRLTMAPGFYE